MVIDGTDTARVASPLALVAGPKRFVVTVSKGDPILNLRPLDPGSSDGHSVHVACLHAHERSPSKVETELPKLDGIRFCRVLTGF